MKQANKIFLSGAICAVIVASGQFVYNSWLEHDVRQLEIDCIREGKQERFPLLCDGEEIEKLQSHGPAVGIQAKLLAAHRELRQARFNPDFLTIAFVVFTVSAVPWLWYFLLRRLRELRNVIAGSD